MEINEIVVDVLGFRRKDLLEEPSPPKSWPKWFMQLIFSPMVTVTCGRKSVRIRREAIVLAKQIYFRISKRWKEGLDYNAWYTLHNAKDCGLLNEFFEPCDGGTAPPSRMAELYRLGGIKAVAAYKEVFPQ